MEEAVHGFGVDDEDVQNVGDDEASEEPTVAKHAEAQGGAGLAFAIEGIEPLANGQHGEGLGLDEFEWDVGGQAPDEEAEGGQNGSWDHQGHASHHLAGDEGLIGRDGRRIHLIALGLFHDEVEGEGALGDEVDPQDLDGGEGQGVAEDQGGHEDDHLVDGGREQEQEELLKIGVNQAALFDGAHDGGEIVIGDDDACGALGNFGSGQSHGDADIGPCESWGIIDAVTGHGDDVALGLEGLDDAEFLGWMDASEDGDAIELGSEFLFGHGLEFATVDCPIILAGDAEAAGDGEAGGFMVAGDHDGTDAGVETFGDGVADLGSGRVELADEAEEHDAATELFEPGVLVEFAGDFADGEDAKGLLAHGFACLGGDRAD